MSWVEVDGAGWDWVDVNGAGWRWVQGLVIPIFKYAFETLRKKKFASTLPCASRSKLYKVNEKYF